MALTLTTPNTVLGVLSPKSQSARLVINLVTVVLGSLVLALSAKVSVPVMPIPVTLQTMVVAALAAGFGWRIGVATVALYIVEGLSGLPVFATGGGLDYIMRPSFGFILGYLPMAYIIGRAADLGASRRLVLLFGAMLLADAVLFAFGRDAAGLARCHQPHRHRLERRRRSVHPVGCAEDGLRGAQRRRCLEAAAQARLTPRHVKLGKGRSVDRPFRFLRQRRNASW